MLILHFIDYAVEPFYYDKGIDLYEDGGNYSLASLLYYTGDTLLKGDNFREILFLFQHAMKSKTEVSVVALLEKVKASPWHELPEALGPLAHESPSCIEAIMHKGTSTDGAYVVLLSLISRLEAVLSKNYGFFVILCGFQDGARRAGNQVDHGHERLRVAISPSSGTRRLEYAIQAFQSRIGIG